MSYVNALTLFRQGKDTAEIAEILGCSEATAYNALHDARQAERTWHSKKLSAYRCAPKPKPQPKLSLIPYAGAER